MLFKRLLTSTNQNHKSSLICKFILFINQRSGKEKEKRTNIVNGLKEKAEGLQVKIKMALDTNTKQAAAVSMLI